jgi:hypothetical protein
MNTCYQNKGVLKVSQSVKLKMLMEDGKVYVNKTQVNLIRNTLNYCGVKHFEFPLGEETLFEIDIE